MLQITLTSRSRSPSTANLIFVKKLQSNKLQNPIFAKKLQFNKL
jgi:hypothetical protein